MRQITQKKYLKGAQVSYFVCSFRPVEMRVNEHAESLGYLHNYCLYQGHDFNESIENNQIYFDYKIKKGKANTRNAIELLRITQFPEKVYTRAKQTIE